MKNILRLIICLLFVASIMVSFNSCEIPFLNNNELDTPETPEEPDEPEIPDPDEGIVYDYDENEVYFTYEVNGSSVFITGLTELGKAQTTLRTPVAYDGKKVTQIAENAFAGGSNIKELYVTDNISWIADGAFRGADSLTKIHILATDPDMTKVNSIGNPREGLPSESRFYVPRDSLSVYANNYFWGPFAEYLIGE